MFDDQTLLRANISMRMILRSSHDATLFDNKPYDFNVQLDKQTHIEGNWVVALTEIKVNYTGTSKQVKDIYVYTNVCTGSIVGKSERPLLPRVHIDTNNTSQIKASKTLSANIVFDTPYYFPVRANELDQIRIYIKDEKDADCSLLDGDTCVTLHFKRFLFI